MGSSSKDGDSQGSEIAAHGVCLKGFWTEINNSKSNNNQTAQDTGNYPVMNFKEEFLVILNKKSLRVVYRLPS